MKRLVIIAIFVCLTVRGHHVGNITRQECDGDVLTRMVEMTQKILQDTEAIKDMLMPPYPYQY